MHTTKIRRSVWAMALGLVVALALTGVVALAQEWVTGERTVTVKPAESQAADLETTDIVVDLYRIADVTARTDAHTYDIKSSDSDIQKALDSGDWQKLADAGLAKVESGLIPLYTSAPLFPEAPIKLGPDESANGVYLMLPHGQNEGATSLKGYSKTIEYTFQPSIVTIPTKDQLDENEHVNSAYGNWITEGTIVLKATGVPRFGDLKIPKTLKRYNGDPVSFVFRVVAVDENRNEQPNVYANYAMAHFFPDSKETEYAELHHIPADITVKVEEVYTGSHDEKSAGNEPQFIQIKGSEMVEVEPFVNEPDDDIPHGHGIENQFTFDDKEGDWHWNAKPADKAESDKAVKNQNADATGQAEAGDQTAETQK